MAWPFLYFAGEKLSIAELSAARVDGHLVEVGEGYMPADAVETAVMRAASLRPVLGDTLAAIELTAAWIHGMLAGPPLPHTVQRATRRRLHPIVDRRLRYRDVRLDPADALVRGGVRVSTPLRTLVDLSRRGDEAAAAAARRLVATGLARTDDAFAWFDRHRVLPHRRTALALLERLACEGDQDDVTR